MFTISAPHIQKKKNLLSQYSVLAKAYKIIKFNNDDVQITRIIIYRKNNNLYQATVFGSQHPADI